MKKFIFAAAVLCAGLTYTACSSDDTTTDITSAEAATLDYSSQYAASWGNYARQVAYLLQTDAAKLSGEWTGGFAAKFKDGSWSGSQKQNIEQILDGCIDIANEVGTAKIGEPYDYWSSGRTTEAVYAVESWYSWHSRDDYSNNIRSIANSLLGVRLSGAPTTSSVTQANTNSIYAYAQRNSTMDVEARAAWAAVVAAYNSIQAIPQPFRNNIGSAETQSAMTACDDLVNALERLKALIVDNNDETGYAAITERYVDAVVLPTYADLAAKNVALYNAVSAFASSPSNAAFSTACEAWLSAREPWETSEAFLFGPVDELGLDPNMDSWPLDQAQIVRILTSGNYDSLNWSDGDSNDAIEAAQNLRGFHTLEYLIFKDGVPRTVN